MILKYFDYQLSTDNTCIIKKFMVATVILIEIIKLPPHYLPEAMGTGKITKFTLSRTSSSKKLLWGVEHIIINITMKCVRTYIWSWCTELVKQLVAVGTALTETNTFTDIANFIFDIQYFTGKIKHILYTKIRCLQFLS